MSDVVDDDPMITMLWRADLECCEGTRFAFTTRIGPPFVTLIATHTLWCPTGSRIVEGPTAG